MEKGQDMTAMEDTPEDGGAPSVGAVPHEDRAQGNEGQSSSSSSKGMLVEQQREHDENGTAHQDTTPAHQDTTSTSSKSPLKTEKEQEKEEPQAADEDAISSEDEDGEGDDAPIRRLEPQDLEDNMELVMGDTFHHYYISTTWTAAWYYKLAYEGFISVRHGSYLLPEIQRAYCVLHFENMHIGRKTRRLKKNGYRLYNNRNWKLCVSKICDYWGSQNWFSQQYANLVRVAGLESSQYTNTLKLVPHSIELYDEHDTLIAGECGYSIGSVYTSLTGFCDKSIANGGLFQMYYLGKWLERSGYAFWNLGHPPRPPKTMKYKADLGGVVLNRGAFLPLWRAARSQPLTGEGLGPEFVWWDG
ncbi:unnamed protein product [Amoebophrya sp. A25]|nr:unnamed protein product [Amoebophrya sp. A25]|eukprot:GSA25T00003106001.1